MKTEAIWITKPFHAEVLPMEIADEPKPDEVQIETKVCGICAWDSAMYQGITGPGDPPYVIGHEAAGIITKVGSMVKDYKVGDKVAVCSATDCVQMAKVVNNKTSGICRLPDDLTDWKNAVYEPTCCVVNLLYLSGITPGDKVAIVGCGYMGALTLMGLVNGSCAGDIIVFETIKERQELARKIGAKKVYGSDGDGLQKLLAEGGADIVIDFSSGQGGFEFAQKCLRPKSGKLVLGAWHRQDLTFSGTDWHMGGITIYNLSPQSNRHYEDMIPRTAALVERGVYMPGDLVTHAINYKDPNLNHIFETSISKKEGYMKGVILFDD